MNSRFAKMVLSRSMSLFTRASAMSWLLFVVVAMLTWVTNRLFRQRGQ